MDFLQIVAIFCWIFGGSYVLSFIMCFDIKDKEEKNFFHQIFLCLVGIVLIIIGFFLFNV